MKYKQLTSFPIIALFLALAPTALANNTWYVDGVNGNDPYNCVTTQTACKTIGHAISLASSRDSIVVAPATHTERLGIANSLNVIGSGARTTIIDGHAAGSVIVISSPAQVTLSNITVRNGHSSFGTGIYNEGRLTINSSTVTGNNANFFGNIISCCAYGGGIYNGTNGTLTINNSTLAVADSLRFFCATVPPLEPSEPLAGMAPTVQFVNKRNYLGPGGRRRVAHRESLFHVQRVLGIAFRASLLGFAPSATLQKGRRNSSVHNELYVHEELFSSSSPVHRGPCLSAREFSPSHGPVSEAMRRNKMR